MQISGIMKCRFKIIINQEAILNNLAHKSISTVICVDSCMNQKKKDCHRKQQHSLILHHFSLHTNLVSIAFYLLLSCVNSMQEYTARISTL